MIINIVINIKKGSGGNNAMLLSDFALEPSENFNLSFLRTDFADFEICSLWLILPAQVPNNPTTMAQKDC